MLERRKNRLLKVAGMRQQGVVVFEDIHDPHNAAACLRTLEAFGFQKAYFIFEQEKRFNPRQVGKVVASSGNKWLEYEVFNSTEKCLKKLKKEGYELIATVVGDKTEDFYRAKFINPKIAVLMGNEHRGLSKEAVELADRKVMIPMRGFVESFNLSVTTSLFLYEITRQRISRGMKKYLYKGRELKKLEKEFLKRGSR